MKQIGGGGIDVKLKHLCKTRQKVNSLSNCNSLLLLISVIHYYPFSKLAIF